MGANYEKENYDTSIYHFKKYWENSEESSGFRYANSLISVADALNQANQHDEAMLMYRKALENSQDLNEDQVLLALMNLSDTYRHEKDDIDNAQKYCQKFVDKCIDLEWEDGFPNFYKTFCKGLQMCDSEKAEKIQNIMDDVNAFRYPNIDAYEKWSELTSVHKKYIQKNRPKEYALLASYLEFAKGAMLQLNRFFTDATVGIIHD